MEIILGFVRDLIGEECFEKIVIRRILDEMCVKIVISKLLG